MSSIHQTERNRGTKEFRQQLATLREKWPLAFPFDDQQVRPLGTNAAHEIAAAMGWSVPYTLGVLRRWKMSAVYCEAVLRYDQRNTLDGTPAEPVDAQAKDLATNRLAQLAARQAAKNAAKPAEPAPAKPKPTASPAMERPLETPEQLRSRVRASLLRRRA
jgi:sRNA-binding protein